MGERRPDGFEHASHSVPTQTSLDAVQDDAEDSTDDLESVLVDFDARSLDAEELAMAQYAPIMPYAARAMTGNGIEYLLPSHPTIQTGPVTKRLPIKQATMARPGFKPKATALEGTCICAGLKPSATQKPPTCLDHY
ncbi:hypothetical protein PV11_08437 [Exophiala sideris]|uniref:Uncharacterized protein n=1 Tax=Exophiala sideris TaxID=1016849 RepID=A0A0D1YDE0_9EURO|nr:hypothetical protein PV11_08437 [Exophiala sideris]